MIDIRDNLMAGALPQLDSAADSQGRRQPDAIAEATAGTLSTDWTSEPRGAGRLQSIGARFVFSHDGSPEQDSPAKKHNAILLQFFAEAGIRVTGFGVHGDTTCILIECPEDVGDRQLENLTNAAWLAACGGSDHPLKKAKKNVIRRLNRSSQAGPGKQEKVDQQVLRLTDIPSPKVNTSLGQSQLKHRQREHRRECGRKLIRTGLR